ncbi:MAG: AAA family ATPase [Rhodocyclaceae bacterium]|nr:AAA family ATPase [Rhodocyclaceae bacterium]
MRSPPTPPPLIRSLLDPGRYPHPVGCVELVETHISWVLLAGDFAYKLKKPVTLPFVDFGTLERRRADCAAELRLNRRYAPGLYLDAVDFDGEPAVKMRRFDEARRLDRVCARGELTPAHLSGLARTIVAFHSAAAIAPPSSRFGTPEQVLAPARENFDELDKLLPGESPRLTLLRAWTEAEFARRRDVFAARKAGGFVRECHGDLHLGNLVLLGDRVTPFDCIEFNEDFRWIDVASEIAFTYIDLLDHGQPGLACWLLNEWLARSGDHGGHSALAVLRFYAVYRAMVRAKVAALRGRAAEAAGYLALAERLGVSPRLTLTITFGLSGSGKTTASSARLLADASAATVRFRSDVERKRLFGLDADADSGGTIYAVDASVRTYARLAELARATLADGWPVIVDAAFLKRAERRTFAALADELDIPFDILACAAPVDALRGRLEARRDDASEATAAVLAQQLEWLEPLDDAERARVTAPDPIRVD